MPWFSPGEGLDKEPVPAAEDIELPAPEPGQAAFQPPLRVQSPQDDAVPGDQSQQHQGVLPLHGVSAGDVPLPVAGPDGEGVLPVGLPGPEGRQPLAAAGEVGTVGGLQEIPALGAAEKPEVLHISPGGGVFRQLPPEEIPGVHPQQLGQLGQQGNVGCAPAVFPFGDRLVADAQGLGQGGLGHAFRKAEGADERARLGLVHENRPPFAPDGTTGGDNAQETLRRVGLYRGKLSGIKGPKNPRGGGESAQNLCLEG